VICPCGTDCGSGLTALLCDACIEKIPAATWSEYQEAAAKVRAFRRLYHRAEADVPDALLVRLDNAWRAARKAAEELL
jgi:hypothetical protein